MKQKDPGAGMRMGGPQTPGERQNVTQTVSLLLETHYERMLRHARRQIRHDEVNDLIAAGAIDPCGVVDEVARQILASAGRKPDEASYLIWFYALLRDELKRRRHVERVRPVESLDETPAAADSSAEEELQDTVQTGPLERRDFEDAAHLRPDQEASEHDLLEHLQGTIQNWPTLDRELFELHFVEGFEADEVAMILRQPLEKIEGAIVSVQSRLRQAVLAEAMA